MMIYDDIWWYMMVYDGIWWYMMIYAHCASLPGTCPRGWKRTSLERWYRSLHVSSDTAKRLDSSERLSSIWPTTACLGASRVHLRFKCASETILVKSARVNLTCRIYLYFPPIFWFAKIAKPVANICVITYDIHTAILELKMCICISYIHSYITTAICL
jgi:hypothetical protein